MEKDIRSTDIVACKLGVVSTKVTNQNLEVAREERRKRKEMVEMRVIIAMASKRQKARRGIILSNEEKKNYESDTGDETDLNQAGNNKNSLLL